MPGGRPPIKIKWKEFDKLCSMQATLTEIADWFGCDIGTIENKVRQRTKGKMGFSEYHKKKSVDGKISLRRMQFQAAMGETPVIEVKEDGTRVTLVKGTKPDTGMLVWLGKQYLEQREKQEITGEGGGPLQICPWDLRKLSTEKLRVLEEILGEIAGRPQLPSGGQG